MDFEIDMEEYNRLIVESTDELLSLEVDDSPRILNTEESIVDIIRKNNRKRFKDIDLRDKNFVTIVNIKWEGEPNKDNIQKDIKVIQEDLSLDHSYEMIECYLYDQNNMNSLNLMIFTDKEYNPDLFMLKLSGNGCDFSISDNMTFDKKKVVEHYIFTVNNLWGRKELLKNADVTKAFLENELNDYQISILDSNIINRLSDQFYLEKKLYESQNLL